MCGSLSKPSKMPCHGYGLSAFNCRTGGKLAQIPGNVCEHCYAMRGNYLYPSVIKAHVTRHAAIAEDIHKWEDDMYQKILREEQSGYFRWHDSGDVQSPEHLRAIVNLAHRLPHIRFWLPTKEYDWIAAINYEVPENLTIRVSHPMVGKVFVGRFEGRFETSSVGHYIGHLCPAREQDNKCGTCRACWDHNTVNVNYPQH